MAQSKDKLPAMVGDLTTAQLIEVRDQAGQVLLNGTFKTSRNKADETERRTLRELIPPTGMASGEFVDVAVSLADAINAAHARGVTHRDLKPENIMITPSGWVKVLDFGLAKFRSDTIPMANLETAMADPEVTRAGVLLGTAPYMSPEQAEGRPVDQRSDLFSLGVVFYEMLTGRQPFRGRSVAQLLSSILRDDPPPLRASRTEIIPEIEDVVGRCLRKEPSHRWASAADVHQSLVDIRRRLLSDAARQDSDRTAAVARPRASWLDSRWGLSAILVLLWLVNWIETSAEDVWSTRTGDWIGYQLAAAFQWLEGALSFEGHDAAGPVAVYLGSIAYFFLPVVLLALTLVALVPRQSVSGYRQFTFAIVACYVLSLPFYLGRAGSGTVGLSGVSRHPAVRPLVDASDRDDSTDQRPRQLLSELSRLRHLCARADVVPAAIAFPSRDRVPRRGRRALDGVSGDPLGGRRRRGICARGHRRQGGGRDGTTPQHVLTRHGVG